MLNELRVTPQIRGIIKHPARFKVLTTGRRWGKDRCGMIWLHHGNLFPGKLYWYVAPYRKQAKAIAWPVLKMLARHYGVTGRDISESELSVAWPNGAKTELKGADNEDSLLGVGVERVLMTEYTRWKSGIWEQVIRPMLTQSKGSAMFNSSPLGLDKHYDLHQRGLDPGDPDWMSWSFKTKDSPFVDPAEVEAAKRDMDPVLYRQEYEASFETSGNRAAHMFDHEKHVKHREPSADCWIGMDFNVAKMCSKVWCNYPDGSTHCFDEVTLYDSNTPEMIAVLRRKFPQIRKVYPDPSCRSKNTAGNRTDARLLEEAGFHVIAHRAAPTHRDRNNAVNRKLENAVGEVALTVEPTCRGMIAAFERTQIRPDGTIDKKDENNTSAGSQRKVFSHDYDAGTYGIEYQWPVITRVAQMQQGFR